MDVVKFDMMGVHWRVFAVCIVVLMRVVFVCVVFVLCCRYKVNGLHRFTKVWRIECYDMVMTDVRVSKRCWWYDECVWMYIGDMYSACCTLIDRICVMLSTICIQLQQYVHIYKSVALTVSRSGGT